MMVALAGPDGKFQARFQRADVAPPPNLELSFESFDKYLCRFSVLACPSRPDRVPISDAQCQWVIGRQRLLGISDELCQIATGRIDLAGPALRNCQLHSSTDR